MYTLNYAYESELKADSCQFRRNPAEFRNSGQFLRIPLEFPDSGGFRRNTWRNKKYCLIEERHSAPHFQHYLKVFLNSFNTKKVASRHLDAAILPFKQVNVYNMFRFHPQGIHDEEEESDIVRALSVSQQNPRGRFDTVITISNDTAESTGLDGKRSYFIVTA